MRQPDISVVIPAYNAEATIDRAIGSALAQEDSGRLLEVVVVDDGSKDGTRDLIQKAASASGGKLRLISQGNAGPSAARNIGMAAARAPLAAFLDADDEWLPGKLAIQAAILDEHPEAALVSCTVSGHGFRGKPGVFPVSFEQLLKRNYVTTSGVLLRREDYFRAGGFDPRRRLSEDYELWLRMARREALLVLNKAFVVRGPGGISSSLWPMEKGELETYDIMAHEGWLSASQLMATRIWSLSKYLVRTLARQFRGRQ